MEADTLCHLDHRYHCQDIDTALIFRYDSAPHFPELPRFPYATLLSADQVFGDATASSWREARVLLPSPEKFIVQNIIHGFLVNTKVNLYRVFMRDLFELALASATYRKRVAWDAVVSRFERFGEANSLREYVALAKDCLGLDLSPDIPSDGRDQSRIRWQLTRLNTQSPSREFAINCFRQLRRIKNLRKHPKKILLLFTADFWSRLFRSF